MRHKVKTKNGVCEVHLYNNDDNKNRNVKWSIDCQMWICDKCDDVVLKATATINKRIELKKKNKQ